MRILVDYRPALTRRTGVGEYVHESLTALIGRPSPEETLSIFSASWKDRLDPNAVPGTTVVDSRVPTSLLHFLWHRLEWPDVSRLSGSRFDIVQSAHPLLIPAKDAARLVTIYDLDFLDHPERTVREIRRDYGPLAASHARRADQVIVISRHTAEEVERRLEVPAERISVCTPGAPDWQVREAEPVDGGYILFLGTLEPRKNLDVLLDAYGRLIGRLPTAPNLVLAGHATDEAAPVVERSKRPPFSGRVILPGYIAPEARESLYKGALMFVMPSHTEGFGLPGVEAMRAGVPVIAAKRGALTESVGAGGWLLDPVDAESLAQAMFTVASDPARRRAMCDAGREHARQFTWKATAEAMRDAWTLASHHRARRRG